MLVTRPCVFPSGTTVEPKKTVRRLQEAGQSNMYYLKVARILNERHKLDVPPDFAETVELCFEKGPPQVQRFSKSIKTLVFDNYGYKLDVHLHMAIILLPILLTALVRNLKYLAPLSTLANVLMMIGIVIVIYYSSTDLPPISDRHYLAKANQWPLFFGTAVFAFEGIGLVLPLQNEMKEPRKFGQPLGVLNVGMSIVAILYVVVGFLAYLKYGEKIEGSVTLNLPETEIYQNTAKVAGKSLASSDHLCLRAIGPKRLNILNVNIVSVVLAEAIPFLGLFISLVGAVCSTTLMLVFPAILDLVTCYMDDKTSLFVIVKDVFLLILCVVGIATGGYESINAIAKAFGHND
ncbi:hypothetical protein NQ317_009641 [Molorchus minor]|uniref:Amino acid transporter transmembrane domain-containing protein n=1 Tax=Molorchus minor TaxID=1323400 RepID=A0ABQ9JVP4_9CUCU|nr:hypothetical protein NQ317_009641 [Molorchus minor]